MERYSRIGILSLWFINILFVYMGYVGISGIERHDFPPFHHGPGLMTIFDNFNVVPDRILLFWHSVPGHVII